MCGMLTVPVILVLSSCLLVADRQQPSSGFKHHGPSLLTCSVPGPQSCLVIYQRSVGPTLLTVTSFIKTGSGSCRLEKKKKQRHKQNQNLILV